MTVKVRDLWNERIRQTESVEETLRSIYRWHDVTYLNLSKRLTRRLGHPDFQLSLDLEPSLTPNPKFAAHTQYFRSAAGTYLAAIEDLLQNVDRSLRHGSGVLADRQSGTWYMAGAQKLRERFGDFDTDRLRLAVLRPLTVERVDSEWVVSCELALDLLPAETKGATMEPERAKKTDPERDPNVGVHPGGFEDHVVVRGPRQEACFGAGGETFHPDPDVPGAMRPLQPGEGCSRCGEKAPSPERGTSKPRDEYVDRLYKRCLDVQDVCLRLSEDARELARCARQVANRIEGGRPPG